MTKFKEVFIKSGMKQNVLAEKVGVTPQAITQWFSKGLPPSRTFEVAKILKVPVAELVENEPSDELKELLEGIERPFATAQELIDRTFDNIYSFKIEDIRLLAGQILGIAETKERLEKKKD